MAQAHLFCCICGRLIETFNVSAEYHGKEYLGTHNEGCMPRACDYEARAAQIKRLFEKAARLALEEEMSRGGRVLAFHGKGTRRPQAQGKSNPSSKKQRSSRSDRRNQANLAQAIKRQRRAGFG